MRIFVSLPVGFCLEVAGMMGSSLSPKLLNRAWSPPVGTPAPWSLSWGEAQPPPQDPSGMECWLTTVVVGFKVLPSVTTCSRHQLSTTWLSRMTCPPFLSQDLRQVGWGTHDSMFPTLMEPVAASVSGSSSWRSHTQQREEGRNLNWASNPCTHPFSRALGFKEDSIE